MSTQKCQYKLNKPLKSKCSICLKMVASKGLIKHLRTVHGLNEIEIKSRLNCPQPNRSDVHASTLTISPKESCEKFGWLIQKDGVTNFYPFDFTDLDQVSRMIYDLKDAKQAILDARERIRSQPILLEIEKLGQEIWKQHGMPIIKLND